MLHSAPLELLADAVGTITFGWADEGVYYARFSQSLSERLGETFAARLSAGLAGVSRIHYFADARDLDSYELLARSAIFRVLKEHRDQLERIDLLWWGGSAPNDVILSELGDVLYVTLDAEDFEARLRARAPEARAKLAAKHDSSYRNRRPLRR
jgi:hypothetical protein